MTTYKDNFVIPKWMVSELHLSGFGLLTFAAIYNNWNGICNEHKKSVDLFEIAELGLSKSVFGCSCDMLIKRGLIHYIPIDDDIAIRVTYEALVSVVKTEITFAERAETIKKIHYVIDGLSDVLSNALDILHKLNASSAVQNNNGEREDVSYDQK